MATRSGRAPSGNYLDVIPATNVDEKANIGDSFIILCRLERQVNSSKVVPWLNH